MTEEYEPQTATFGRSRRNIVSKTRENRKESIRRCIFCDFVRDITESECLESKDEEMVLLHLKQEHGFDR